MKKCDIFLFFAQNIDCWYMIVPTIYVFEQILEKNEHPCEPMFYYIKVGCKGVLIIRTCYPDQNQNSLLVKRQNDNTSPGDWPRKICKEELLLSLPISHTII